MTIELCSQCKYYTLDIDENGICLYCRIHNVKRNMIDAWEESFKDADDKAGFIKRLCIKALYAIGKRILK